MATSGDFSSARDKITSLIDSGVDLTKGRSATRAKAQDSKPNGQEAPLPDDKSASEPPKERETEQVQAPASSEESDGEGQQAGEALSGETEAYYETLAELAEGMEASVDDLMPLKLQVKSRGKKQEVTLQDLVRDYQQFDDYQAKTTRLAEQRRKHDAELQAWAEERHRQQQHVEQQLQMAEQMLSAQWHSPELKELEQDDPGQAALRRQQMQEQAQQIQWARHQQMVQAQQQMQQYVQQHQQREYERLIELSPSWNEDAKRRVESFVTDRGFSPDEIKAVGASAQLTHALHELVMLREKGQQKQAQDAHVQKVLKKLKKQVPRTIPGGNGADGRPQPAPPVRVRKAKELKKHARKTGNVRDAASAISALLS